MDRKIRVGIVGCGEVTQILHLPSLYQLPEKFSVTALCDISPKVVEEVGQHWNVSRVSTTYQEIVGDQEVDAVLVANPNIYHAEVTVAAARAGKHVLVEKPMCVSKAEAEQIMEAEASAGVAIQVGYMRRYAPAFAEACREVRSLGPVRFARVRDFIGQNALIINQTSRVVRDEALQRQLKDELQAREALAYAGIFGEMPRSLQNAYSVLLGLSSHDLSAMREILGRPTKVLFAEHRQEGRYLAAAFDYGSFVCLFETGIDEIPRFDAKIEILGRNKVVEVCFDTPYVRNLPIELIITEANERGGVNRQRRHPEWGDPFVEEWRAFHRSICEQAQTKSNPADFVNDLTLFEEMIRQMGGFASKQDTLARQTSD